MTVSILLTEKQDYLKIQKRSAALISGAELGEVFVCS